MSKSVCILRSNPVNPDSRVEKEAVSLQLAGYDVHIFAWDRDSNHKAIEEKITIAGNDIPITRVGFKASYGEGMKNIVAYLKFQFSMRFYLKKHCFDIVHACDFDTAFFTYKLVKRRKEKFIFDIFDILGDDEKNPVQRILKKVQMRIVNAADGTIICTEERRNQISKSKPKKLAIIHNSPSKKQISDTKKSISNIRPKVCYVGILQDGRLLREIGEYAVRNKDIELHIGGFGLLEGYFKEISKNNENIFFYGRLPYEKTLELESQSDIMLAIYDPSISNHRFAAPNKFYESLFLGKPVIMAKGTGMSNVVEENDIGCLIDYSYKGFEDGIAYLLTNRKRWSSMSEHMIEIYEKEYSWEEMERRLVALYGDILSEG